MANLDEVPLDMILEQLDTLRAAHPGCTTVALADISSGLVLSVSTHTKRPQEELDNLCHAAAELLSGDMAVQIAGKLGADTGPQESIVLSAGGTCIFLRSKDDPAEALLCQCSDDIAVEPFLQDAKSALAKITASQ